MVENATQKMEETNSVSIFKLVSLFYDLKIIVKLLSQVNFKLNEGMNLPKCFQGNWCCKASSFLSANID